MNALLSAKEGGGEGGRKFKGGTQDGEVRVRQGTGSIQVDHTSRLQLGEVLKCAQSAAASAQAAASIQADCTFRLLNPQSSPWSRVSAASRTQGQTKMSMWLMHAAAAAATAAGAAAAVAAGASWWQQHAPSHQTT